MIDFSKEEIDRVFEKMANEELVRAHSLLRYSFDGDEDAFLKLKTLLKEVDERSSGESAQV